MTDKPIFTEDDIIFSYTRGQAIADGVLVDITELAKEAGIKFPTAITAQAWGAAIEPPADCPCQSVEGRAWDVLQVLRFTARMAGRASCIDFVVRVKQQTGISRDIALKALAHPGDEWEPVITIMLPHED